MKGTVKFFDRAKGWGFLTSNDGKDVFVHHSNIVMDGFRSLNEDDIVDFEIGTGKDGREQAVNVKLILTRQMIEDSLKGESLHIQTMKDSYGATKYVVVDADNTIQTDENGMPFLELAAYAGFDVEGL